MPLFGNKKDTTKKDDAKKDEIKKPAAKKAVVKADSKSKKEDAAASMKDLYGAGAKKVVKSKTGKKATINFDGSYKVLIRPLITEKATNLVADNKYAFVVDKAANKIEVAQAVEATYGVKPLDVNVINVKGKRVMRGRIKGKRKDFKKALVTLKKGETIKLYEGV